MTDEFMFVRNLHAKPGAAIADVGNASRFCLEVPLKDAPTVPSGELFAIHQARFAASACHLPCSQCALARSRACTLCPRR